MTEANLLPESAVFIDDNPREIDKVRARFPSIRCLGGNHHDWRRIILLSPETQLAQISQESQIRTGKNGCAVASVGAFVVRQLGSPVGVAHNLGKAVAVRDTPFSRYCLWLSVRRGISPPQTRLGSSFAIDLWHPQSLSGVEYVRPGADRAEKMRPVQFQGSAPFFDQA